MEPNKAFKEYKDTQEQIKQMCIEYSKTYFKASDTEALLKYFEENNDKLLNLNFSNPQSCPSIHPMINATT
jgi:hypothetical protein